MISKAKTPLAVPDDAEGMAQPTAQQKELFQTETKGNDEKIAGRYDPDDFDQMVARLGQRARAQERQHGPVDIGKLAQRLRDIEQKQDQTRGR